MLSEGQVSAAVAHWARAFPALKVEPPAPPALLWRMRLGGQDVTLFESPGPLDFTPTPAWSFMVDVERAEEVDAGHAVLAEGGSTLMPPDSYEFAERFTWVEDRFKVSWQLRFGAA